MTDDNTDDHLPPSAPMKVAVNNIGKKYYELHITMLGDPAVLRTHVEERNWKFSAINGDPSLGAGLKCYATLHMNSRVPEDEVLERLLNTANFFRFLGIDVVREKIELVIHDSRSSTVKIPT